MESVGSDTKEEGEISDDDDDTPTVKKTKPNPPDGNTHPPVSHPQSQTHRLSNTRPAHSNLPQGSIKSLNNPTIRNSQTDGAGDSSTSHASVRSPPRSKRQPAKRTRSRRRPANRRKSVENAERKLPEAIRTKNDRSAGVPSLLSLNVVPPVAGSTVSQLKPPPPPPPPPLPKNPPPERPEPPPLHLPPGPGPPPKPRKRKASPSKVTRNESSTYREKSPPGDVEDPDYIDMLLEYKRIQKQLAILAAEEEEEEKKKTEVVETIVIPEEQSQKQSEKPESVDVPEATGDWNLLMSPAVTKGILKTSKTLPVDWQNLVSDCLKSGNETKKKKVPTATLR